MLIVWLLLLRVASSLCVCMWAPLRRCMRTGGRPGGYGCSSARFYPDAHVKECSKRFERRKNRCRRSTLSGYAARLPAPCWDCSCNALKLCMQNKIRHRKLQSNYENRFDLPGRKCERTNCELGFSFFFFVLYMFSECDGHKLRR